MRSLTKTFQIVDKETGQVLEEKVVTQHYWFNAKIVLNKQVDGYHRYVYYPAGTELDVIAETIDGFADDYGEYTAMTEEGEEIMISTSDAELTHIACEAVSNYGTDGFRQYFPATIPIEES